MVPHSDVFTPVNTVSPHSGVSTSEHSFPHSGVFSGHSVAAQWCITYHVSMVLPHSGVLTPVNTVLPHSGVLTLENATLPHNGMCS